MTMHRKRSASQSSIDIAIIRDAFSISAVQATGKEQKQRKILRILWLNLRPVYKQSFNEGPFALAEASYTIRTLIVSFSCLIAA